MGKCKDCRFAAPDDHVYRCISPAYPWTFRAGPGYGCDYYQRSPNTLLTPAPRRSSDALKAEIRETLGPHYRTPVKARKRVQVLSALWREALELETGVK